MTITFAVSQTTGYMRVMYKTGKDVANPHCLRALHVQTCHYGQSTEINWRIKSLPIIRQGGGKEGGLKEGDIGRGFKH